MEEQTGIKRSLPDNEEQPLTKDARKDVEERQPIYYRSLRLEELKKISRERGLKVGGKHQELVDRLEMYDLKHGPPKVAPPRPKTKYDDLRVGELKEKCRERHLRMNGATVEIIDRLVEWDKQNGQDEPVLPKEAPVALPQTTFKKTRDHLIECGFDQRDVDQCDAEALGKKFTKVVKQFHSMVDDNWHDGYEDQEEYLERWFNHIQPILNAAHDLAVAALDDAKKEGSMEAMKMAHDTAFAVVDAWEQFKSIPARGGVDDYAKSHRFIYEDKSGNTKKTIDSLIPYFNYIWRIILLCMSARYSQMVPGYFEQCLKEAIDLHIKMPLPENNEEKPEAGKKDEILEKYITDSSVYAEGAQQFKEVFAKQEWKTKTSRYRFYAQKRVRDRRFDDY